MSHNQIENFFEAVRNNDVETVKFILKYIDPSVSNNKALLTAIIKKYPQMVKILLEDSRVNPSSNAQILVSAVNGNNTDILNMLLNDPRVYTPDNIVAVFKTAVYKGNLPIMRRLLNDYKLYSNKKNKEELVEVAVLGNQYDSLIFLLNDKDIGTDYNHNLAISEAIRRRKREITERLIEDGYFNCEYKDLIFRLNHQDWKDLADKVYQICNQDNIITQQLIDATEKGDFNKVNELLKSDLVDVNGINQPDGLSPLEISLLYGYHDIAIILLKDNRIEPSLKNNISLIQAVKKGFTDIVDILLKHNKFDPSILDNNLFIEAAKYGNIDIIKLLLLDNRVNPSAQNNRAFIEAVKNHNIDIIKLLLQDNRIDPSSQNNEAFIWAIKGGDMNIINLLLQDKRVDPSAQNNEAFIKAVENNDINMVNSLLQDNRVDPSAQKNKAIIGASFNGNLNIVNKLLQDYRVSPNVKALVAAYKNGHFNVFDVLLRDDRLYSDPDELYDLCKFLPELDICNNYEYWSEQAYTKLNYPKDKFYTPNKKPYQTWNDIYYGKYYPADVLMESVDHNDVYSLKIALDYIDQKELDRLMPQLIYIIYTSDDFKIEVLEYLLDNNLIKPQFMCDVAEIFMTYLPDTNHDQIKTTKILRQISDLCNN